MDPSGRCSAQGAALRDLLRHRDIRWIEDPTNVDVRFERPRMRAALAQGEGERRIAEGLARSAQAARERRDIGRRAAKLIAASASRPVPGLIRLDHDFPAHGDSQAVIYAMRILLATVGGMSFLADEARCAGLLSRLRLRSVRLCATLSRTVVDARRTGIFLHRESRNLPAPAPPVDNQLWDNRRRVALDRRITLKDQPGDLVIAPLGSALAGERPRSRIFRQACHARRWLRNLRCGPAANSLILLAAMPAHNRCRSFRR
ncbi:hypothetical protein ACVOMV_04210 [Mesorhizobium atlanticum]